MHYRLRTLLILLALGPPAFSLPWTSITGLGTLMTIWVCPAVVVLCVETWDAMSALRQLRQKPD